MMDDQDIIQRIIIASLDFESRCGRKPDKVYLGVREHVELVKILANEVISAFVNIEIKEDDDPIIMVDGLTVYYVSRSSHLGIGF